MPNPLLDLLGLKNKAEQVAQAIQQGLPTKIRVEAVPDTTSSPNSATVAVIAEKAGPVNWLDKLKAYYHTIIILIGSVLVALNESTPLTSMLGEGAKHYVTLGILGLTIVLNFLKSNEVWVNKL